MIVKKEILGEYEKELAENAKGMKPEDVEWIRQKIISDSTGLDLARDSSERESFILLGQIRLIKRIKTSRPKDIRTFVEREIRRESYEQKVSLIQGKVISMKKPDDTLLANLEKKLDEIEKTVQKEDPEHLEYVKGQCSRARLWIRNKRTGREVEF